MAGHRLRNSAMYALGLGFMSLALAKHRLRGYATPNTLSRSDIEGRIAYVLDTFESWRRFLPPGFEVRGKDVLELCPGLSRGGGALFLALGARSYHAIDAFSLAADEEPAFFSELLDRLPAGAARQEDLERARAITAERTPEAFGYEVARDFDIPRMSAGRKFDLIVSCAAFEHYDDVAKTIADTTEVARSGCVSAHIVDFQTHSRWIRERDPNNIYRYSEALYRAFAFSGQPNRKRPADYVRAFEANGWTDVQVVCARAVPPDLVGPSTSGLAAPFDGPDMDMTVLDGVVLARRP